MFINLCYCKSIHKAYIYYTSGEIGGNMGLFLGGSLMTIFEFADLLVAIYYVRAFRREYPT